MHIYQYRAIDSHGRIYKDVAGAASILDLEARLDKLGLDLLSCSRRQGFRIPACMQSSITRRDLILYCYHLEQTCRAGVPLLESLGDLRDSTGSSRLRKITADMIAAIEGGETLSETMQDHPAVFSGILSSLVRAGEQSGQLAEVFSSIVENLKWQDEQAALTKKLLTYPLFVCIVVVGTIFFLMIYLVPDMLQFIRIMGLEVPLHTRILMAISGFLIHYWYLVLFAPLVLVAAIYAGMSISPVARHYLDVIKLSLPLAGTVYSKIVLARITRIMAVMYASGITVIECIKSCEKIAGNTVFENALRRVSQSLIAGESLSRGFEQTHVFPPMVLRMIHVGENTGTLEKSLSSISYFYTRDVRETIDRLQSMIEPAMTLFLGTLIGWMMFSILGPIYDLITRIKI
ncbi:MAG: type II secretion system F family protein [Gammaproteobacteria bacterium]